MQRIGPTLLTLLVAVTASAAETGQFVDDAGLALVRLPADEFTMGSPVGEPGRRPDEHPVRVRLSKDFYIGRYEVTRGQFAKFVEATGYKTDAERGIRGGYGFDESTKKLVGPDKKYTWRFTGFAQTDEHPVVNVSWHDAGAFCRWRSDVTAATYRLPTEAEWEYACRGGTTTAYANGSHREQLVTVGNVVDAAAHALFPERAALKASDGFTFTAPVGRFKPNAFGLHDMHGNVWEWCADWYAARPRPASDDQPRVPLADPQGPAEGRDRVIRGGDWYHDWSFARSAQRYPIYPGLCRRHGGFRVAREVAE